MKIKRGRFIWGRIELRSAVLIKLSCLSYFIECRDILLEVEKLSTFVILGLHILAKYEYPFWSFVHSFALTQESTFANQNRIPTLEFLAANLLPFALENRDANQEIISATTSRNSSPQIADISAWQIHRSLRISVSEVSMVFSKAKEMNLSWPDISQLDDLHLASRFNP